MRTVGVIGASQGSKFVKHSVPSAFGRENGSGFVLLSWYEIRSFFVDGFLGATFGLLGTYTMFFVSCKGGNICGLFGWVFAYVSIGDRK